MLLRRHGVHDDSHSLAFRLEVLVTLHRVSIGEADDIAVIEHIRVLVLRRRNAHSRISLCVVSRIAAVFDHSSARSTWHIFEHPIIRDRGCPILHTLAVEPNGAPFVLRLMIHGDFLCVLLLHPGEVVAPCLLLQVAWAGPWNIQRLHVVFTFDGADFTKCVRARSLNIFDAEAICGRSLEPTVVATILTRMLLVESLLFVSTIVVPSQSLVVVAQLLTIFARKWVQLCVPVLNLDQIHCSHYRYFI